ncbi:MAG: hypothetical protein R3343_03825 [Nitriliruptorales bacterium]|nr:hypothetical protein [Nitriliruptorales bacterium]
MAVQPHTRSSAPPYRTGDRIVIDLGDAGEVEATVSMAIPTDSLDDHRRWRLLYRIDDTTTADLPVHCGDDGLGEYVRPVVARD